MARPMVPGRESTSFFHHKTGVNDPLKLEKRTRKSYAFIDREQEPRYEKSCPDTLSNIEININHFDGTPGEKGDSRLEEKSSRHFGFSDVPPSAIRLMIETSNRHPRQLYSREIRENHGDEPSSRPMKVGVDQIHVPGPTRAYYGHVRIYFWYRPTIDPKIRPALRWYRIAKYENSSGSLFRNSIENLPGDREPPRPT